MRTIWVSPIFQTRQGDFMGHGAFHGYWVEDISKLDLRFGDATLLSELTKQVHQRGMRLVLDLVVNHVGYQAPLLDAHPDWFHTEGTIENWGDAVEVVTHEVHGLPDLAQENDEVYAYLMDAALLWLQTDIDGFRLDAVKHVPLDFWARFNRELLADRPELVLLGEHYDGSPKIVDHVQREGAFTHMFDFPMAFALRDVFCQGQSFNRLASVLSNDRLYTDPNSLVTFLDNHDMPRILTQCGGDRGRVERALTAQLAMRGTPALTYGTESGLEGGEEPFNRGDMRFDEGDGLMKLIERLLQVRSARASLVSGSTRILAYDEGSFFVLLREVEGEQTWVVINGPEKNGIDLGSLADHPGAKFRDLLADEEVDGSVLLEPFDVRWMEPLEWSVPKAKAGSRAVRFTVPEASLEPGQELVVVGSGPELGAWSPVEGVPLVLLADLTYSAKIELPTDLVFAYKVVVRGEGGQVRWEDGPNRTLYVKNSKGEMNVSIALRGE